MMKKILVLSAIFVLLLSSCALPQNKMSSDVKIGIYEGNMAPDFGLKDIDGKEVKLSDYRGKIVILNFFGVWCSWCVKEMPGFINVYNDYKDKNVELLVVDDKDTRLTLINYLNTNGFKIKPVIDDKEEAANLYSVSGFPTSYIIDDAGIIHKVHAGYMDENTLRKILDSIVKK